MAPTAITWPTGSTSVVLVALLAFFALGFRRGIRREMITLVVLGAGWALTNLMTTGVGERLNRLYKGARFFVENLVASEPPSAVWQRVRDLQDPFQTESDVRLLSLVVFVVLAIAVYVWTQRGYMDSTGATGKVLGGLAGVLNGMLFSGVVVQLTGEPTLQIALPTDGLGLRSGDTDSVAVTIVVVAALAIAYGLYTASGADRTD